MDISKLHKSVLLDECIENLNIKPDGIYVDATLGRGGHSEEIAKRLKNGRLISIDRDSDAIEQAGIRLKDYSNITLVKSNFKDIPSVLESLNIDKIDGILFDLGVSSPQLDDAERGFSYMHDAPLDMRMDREEGLSAYNVVNEYSYESIKRVLEAYGEERFASRIANAIIENRPIKTTFELVEVIKKAMPAAALREKQHPAKRTFQGIRIEVNDELGALREALSACVDILKSDGIIAVISFHSLEDRIVKEFLREQATGCTCPKDFPICVCGKKPKLKIVKNKPIVPTDKELDENPRARSAKLRVGQKI